MSSRTILITGGNGALGRAIARAFLAESQQNQVWLGVRERRAQAEELAKEFSGCCSCVDLEVTEPSAWEKAVATIVKVTGRIDVLINNAGKHADGLLATMTAESWNDVISANLDGAFFGCQAVLPSMISQRNGRIVNISSLSGLLAPSGQTNYAAAKAGLNAMTQSLAKEVARMNITVNAVCPGYIETEALSNMNENEKRAAENRVPMRRFGKPEEVAAAVCFLASSAASYITGAILKIDGGIF